MTQNELQAIRERAEKVKLNRWGTILRPGSMDGIDLVFYDAIYEAIRSDIPALLAEVERLRDELETLTLDRDRWRATAFKLHPMGPDPVVSALIRIPLDGEEP